MKKKILTIVLSLTCICSIAVFTGCSSEEQEEPAKQTEATVVQEEAEEPKLIEFTDEELAEVDLTNTYTTRYGDVLQVTFPSFSFDYTDNWQVTQEEVNAPEEYVTLTNADGVEIRFRYFGGHSQDHDFTADSEATSAVEVTKAANCDFVPGYVQANDNSDLGAFAVAQIMYTDLDNEMHFAAIPESMLGSHEGVGNMVEGEFSFWYSGYMSLTTSAVGEDVSEESLKEIAAILKSFRAN